MILADTSAWVEFERASGSSTDLRVTQLVGVPGALAVTEPVIMEFLAGARSDHRADELRQLMQTCALLRFDASSDFEAAALVYRRCRASGVTPRGLIDCMIAAVAWRTGSVLLAHDADLVRIAGVLQIQLDPASLGLG